MKIIIICPPSVVSVWQNTFKYWVDWDLPFPTMCETGSVHAKATIERFVRNGIQLQHTFIMTQKPLKPILIYLTV